MTKGWCSTKTLLAVILLSLAKAPIADDEHALRGLDLGAEERLAFVETTFNSLLRKPVERPGELWREGDTLIMELAEPRWEQRRLSPTRATLVRDRARTRPGTPKQQRLSLKLEADNPAHGLLLALRAALIGDTMALTEQMTISERTPLPEHLSERLPEPLHDERGWQIHLAPKTEVKGLCGLTLRGRGDGDDSQLEQVDVDQCGNWQRIDVITATPIDSAEPAILEPGPA